VSLLWIGAVFAYWREFVPLLPTAVIPLPAREYEFRGTGSGEVVSIREWDGSHRRESAYSGPIQFWDPREGKIVRQFFREHDVILALSRSSRLAVVREGEEIRMVDLRSGGTLFSRKATGGYFQVRFSQDERFVSFEDPDISRCVCDAMTGQELWSRRVNEWEPLEPGALVGDLFLCHRRTPSPDANSNPAGAGPPPDRIWLSAHTGLPEQRFGVRDKVRIDSDLRRAIVWDDVNPARICDFRTGATLWSFPAEVAGHTPEITLDGLEVVLPLMKDGRIFVARWRTDDGRVVSPLPVAPYKPVPADMCADRRYLVHYDEKQMVRGPVWLRRVVNGLGIRWDGVLLPQRMTLWLVDSESGRPIGRLGSGFVISGLADEGGFAIQEENRVAYYKLLPPRDFRWLATWSLGPIASVWLMRALRRRTRMIRSSGANISAYNRL
jgi:hypothetical protein